MNANVFSNENFPVETDSQEASTNSSTNLRELEVSLQNVSTLPNLNQAEASQNKKMYLEILTSTPFTVVPEKKRNAKSTAEHLKNKGSFRITEKSTRGKDFESDSEINYPNEKE